MLTLIYNTMKIKTIKTIKTVLVALTALFISAAVLMSSAHMKDIVKGAIKDPSHDTGAMTRSVDPVTRALGDLHNHTDKQTLKNISMDNPMAARERELKGVSDEERDRGILEIIEEMVAFYRLAFAMRFSLAMA